MKIIQKQLIRTLFPGLGIVAFASIAHSLVAVNSKVSSTVVNHHSNATMVGTSTPAAQVTVNGKIVPLDSSGQTTVSSPNGSVVNVSSQPADSDSQNTPQSTQATSKTTISIRSGNQGQTTTISPQDNSTDVHVYGSSSAYSSSYNSTSIYNDENGVVRIDQSN